MTEENKNNMLVRLKRDISVNFRSGDEEIILGFIDNYISIAADNSNRRKDDTKLYPYVYEAVKEAYHRRGDEGNSSSNEGGLSSSYIDIVEKLKKDVRTIRVIR